MTHITLTTEDAATIRAALLTVIAARSSPSMARVLGDSPGSYSSSRSPPLSRSAGVLDQAAPPTG